MLKNRKDIPKSKSASSLDEDSIKCNANEPKKKKKIETRHERKVSCSNMDLIGVQREKGGYGYTVKGGKIKNLKEMS